MYMIDVFGLMEKYDISPRHEAGQNFLVDEKVLSKIVAAGDVTDQDNVLEVGPGLGVLTTELLHRAKNVVVIELDRSLQYVLKQEFRAVKHLTVINDDVLTIPFAEVYAAFDNEPFKIVANIPYNITARFLRRFLESPMPPTSWTLLVQKEVAERMAAAPGQLSRLGVSVQYYTNARIVLPKVSREAFYPSPAVDSAVILLEKRDDVPNESFTRVFFQLVRIGFAAKRKQMINNVANGLHISRDEVKALLESVGLTPQVRAQELSIDAWKRLTTQWIKVSQK